MWQLFNKKNVASKLYLLLVRRWCCQVEKVCNEFTIPETTSFKKILVANRGVVATRVYRACRELGIQTVGIYSDEDYKQPFRSKADESYLISRGNPPLQPYLNTSEIIRIAKISCADAIHPGYGYLAQNLQFVRAVSKEGITFIGPTPENIEMMKDTYSARACAIAAGVVVIPGLLKPAAELKEVNEFAKECGFPIILKSSRGDIKIVHDQKELENAFKKMTTIAADVTLYAEKVLKDSRHIEVQILADAHGDVVHFIETDGTLQRNYKKIIQVSPGISLDRCAHEKILQGAVDIAKQSCYQNAGVAKYLTDTRGRIYFKGFDCQLQEEFALVEELTGIDIIQSQIKVAEGLRLKFIGLSQDNIKTSQFGIHCSIINEDPVNNFSTVTGRIQKLQCSGGTAVRIDSAIQTGTCLTQNCDNKIMSLVTTGQTFPRCIERMKRALSETKLHGVKTTNIPFLLNILNNHQFLKGQITTTFVQDNPDLLKYGSPTNQVQKILDYLAEVVINGPTTPFLNKTEPHFIKPYIPDVPALNRSPGGLRLKLKEGDPYKFTEYIRGKCKTMIADTTFCSANTSLLASRLRTYDILRISPFVAYNFGDFYALENWGGCTFDIALGFLRECPWARLKQMRTIIPDIPFMGVLHGASLFGYENYPDNLVNEVFKAAHECGIDIFRVYDALNYLPNIEMIIKIVKSLGALVETGIIYAGDLSDTNEAKCTLKDYIHVADKFVEAGAHVLAVMDPSGQLKPQAAELLISALRERHCSVPIHVQVHDCTGTGVATYLASIMAGADIVSVAADSMSGITSQPSMGAVVASLKNTHLDTGIDLNAVSQYSSYWEQARQLYAPFDIMPAVKSGSLDFYSHEIPGSQMVSLMLLAKLSGICDQFEEVKRAYKSANKILGDVLKVSPISKTIADLAIFMVQNKLTEDDVLNKASELTLPASVIKYLQGHLGQPAGFFPEPFRCAVLKDLPKIKCRPGLGLPAVDLSAVKKNMKYSTACDVDVLSAALYPEGTDYFFRFQECYGPVEKLNTRIFLVGPKMGEEFEVQIERGKTLIIKLLGFSGFVTEEAERIVFFELNGEPRSVYVRDEKAAKEMKICAEIKKE